MNTLKRKRSRGQSLAEFALILPVMLLIIFGMIDMGRAVFMFNSLSESARHANRLAIVDQRLTEIRNRAIDAGPGLGLTAADVEICFKTYDSTQRNCAQPNTERCVASGVPYQREHCLAIVTTRKAFTPMTPIISTIIPSITLTSTSIGPIDYACPNQIRTTTCP